MSNQSPLFCRSPYNPRFLAMPVVPADSPPADAGTAGGGGSGDDEVTLASTPPSGAADAPPAAATKPLEPKGASRCCGAGCRKTSEMLHVVG